MKNEAMNLSDCGDSLRALWLHVADTPRRADLQGNRPTSRRSRVLDMLDPVLEGMLTESVRHDADGREACRLLAGLFLHYVRREVGVEADPAQREVRERLSQLWLAVNADLSGDWPLERMAGAVHVSTGHCHRLVTQHYGVTPMEILRKLRLERAPSYCSAAMQRWTAWQRWLGTAVPTPSVRHFFNDSDAGLAPIGGEVAISRANAREAAS